LMLTPAGGGQNQSASEIPTQMLRFFMSAPHLNGGSCGAAAGEEGSPACAAVGEGVGASWCRGANGGFTGWVCRGDGGFDEEFGSPPA
jgi:hypothetical protein